MSRSTGDLPATVNAGPSGHGKRTTGSVHVPGSRGSTPRARSSFSMTSTHALTTSAATAFLTTRNPSAQKSSIDAAISLTRRRSSSQTTDRLGASGRVRPDRTTHWAFIECSSQRRIKYPSGSANSAP
jgi:hypothetical protein